MRFACCFPRFSFYLFFHSSPLPHPPMSSASSSAHFTHLKSSLSSFSEFVNFNVFIERTPFFVCLCDQLSSYLSLQSMVNEKAFLEKLIKANEQPAEGRINEIWRFMQGEFIQVVDVGCAFPTSVFSEEKFLFWSKRVVAYDGGVLHQEHDEDTEFSRYVYFCYLLERKLQQHKLHLRCSHTTGGIDRCSAQADGTKHHLPMCQKHILIQEGDDITKTQLHLPLRPSFVVSGDNARNFVRASKYCSVLRPASVVTEDPLDRLRKHTKRLRNYAESEGCHILFREPEAGITRLSFSSKSNLVTWLASEQKSHPTHFNAGYLFPPVEDGPQVSEEEWSDALITAFMMKTGLDRVPIQIIYGGCFIPSNETTMHDAWTTSKEPKLMPL